MGYLLTLIERGSIMGSSLTLIERVQNPGSLVVFLKGGISGSLGRLLLHYIILILPLTLAVLEGTNCLALFLTSWRWANLWLSWSVIAGLQYLDPPLTLAVLALLRQWMPVRCRYLVRFLPRLGGTVCSSNFLFQPPAHGWTKAVQLRWTRH